MRMRRVGFAAAGAALVVGCHLGCPDTGPGGYGAICVDPGDCREISLIGAVEGGESWSRSLTESLVIEWLPIRHGWRLRVGPAREELGDKLEHNLVVYAPSHFVPPTAYVEGWHFRNRSNMGPNEGDVNAPQRVREVLLTYDKLGSEADRASWRHDAVVRLRIDELVLGALDRGERAVIDRMRFTMRVTPLSDRWCVGDEPGQGIDAEDPAGPTRSGVRPTDSSDR